MSNASPLPEVTKRNGKTSYRCPRCSEFNLVLDDSLDADITAWRAFSQHRKVCSSKTTENKRAGLEELVPG